MRNFEKYPCRSSSSSEFIQKIIFLANIFHDRIHGTKMEYPANCGALIRAAKQPRSTSLPIGKPFGDSYTSFRKKLLKPPAAPKQNESSISSIRRFDKKVMVSVSSWVPIAATHIDIVRGSFFIT